MGLPQSAVSKRLGVLAHRRGRRGDRGGKQRVYNLEAEKLKAVRDRVKVVEGLWGHQLDRIKERAERNAWEQMKSPTPLKTRKGQS